MIFLVKAARSLRFRPQLPSRQRAAANADTRQRREHTLYNSLPCREEKQSGRYDVVTATSAMDDYYDYAIAAAKLEHKLDDTAVLAPNFRTRDDGPVANEHYWSSPGWKIGNKSLDPKRVSSFTAMDELLVRICPTGPAIFPNLRTVVHRLGTPPAPSSSNR